MGNRRSFLKSIAVGLGALAVDPEELIWRPTKTIFIPEPATYITNSHYPFLTAEQITAEMLRLLKNELKFTFYCNKGYQSEMSLGELYGQAVSIRRPARYER